MGGFMILRGGSRVETAKRIHDATTGCYLATKKVIHDSLGLIYLYDKLQEFAETFVPCGHGDFVFHTGSLLYRGKVGREALRSLYRDFAGDGRCLKDTVGHFAVVMRKWRKLFVLTDVLGSYKVYHNADFSVISSSFVSTAAGQLLPSLDLQGCYEYAWNGACFGGRTIFNEIRSSPANSLMVVSDSVESTELENPLLLAGEPTTVPVSELVDLNVARLRFVFGILANAFGDRLMLSFSGGYDSRLALAALLDAGVRPALFVYGDECDENVRVAEAIAQGEGLDLRKVDKSSRPDVSRHAYRTQVDSDLVLFDGLKVDGIFDTGADAEDRRSRHDDQRIPLNGSLGEIYRNFYYAPDRVKRLEDLVAIFYSRYSPAACSEAFRAKDYGRRLGEAMKDCLRTTAGETRRSHIELLYPLFRGRFWTGRDAAINQRFGWMFFPYLEHAIVADTCNIPIGLKDCGRFQSHLIRQLAPRLAEYPSAYGFRFSDHPPLTYKLSSFLSTHRPLMLRRRSYRLRYLRKRSLPYYLQESYLSTVMDTSFPCMRQLFRIKNIHDPDVLNRVCTMELICQRYSALG